MADQDKKKVTKDLTARELELTALVFQCFDNGAPKINFEKLARVAGFKNAQSASACWGPTKKKLMAMGDAAANTTGGNDDDPASTPKAKDKAAATPSSKRKAVKAELDENGEASPSASAKKARTQNGKGKAKAKAAAVAVDADGGDNADDENGVKNEEEDADYAV